MDYLNGTEGHKLWDFKSKKSIVNKYVIFREEEFIMNQSRETVEIEKDLEEFTSRSKVEFSKKQKKKLYENQQGVQKFFKDQIYSC